MSAVWTARPVSSLPCTQPEAVGPGELPMSTGGVGRAGITIILPLMLSNVAWHE
jgi:hypothetical protein